MAAARHGGQETARRGPRLVIAGGGTGGHVYPGLAVAEAVRAAAPEADIRFVGTRRGLEAALVPAAGWPFATVAASGFRGLGLAARARFVVNFARGWAGSLVRLLRWRPDVVLGTGGYVSAPVLAAARLLRCRLALQEQNAWPGSANRLLGRWAHRVYLGYPEAATAFPGRKCLVTGNPVRAAFRSDRTAPGAATRSSRSLRLLLFGGSRGARTLNRAAREAATLWRAREEWELVVQTGADEREAVAAAFAGWPPGRVRVEVYVDDMPAALAWADLAVCRAGAMTLAELAAAGKPAILVPFPHATDDHQRRNAEAVAAAGAAVVLADDACDGPRLAAAVAALADDPGRRGAMAAASAALARPGAAAAIAADLLALAGRRPARAEGEPRVP